MAKYLNLSGLQTLWTKVKNTFALKSHNHSADDINAGTLPIARGGTGATTRIGAEYNLLNGVESMDATLEDARLFPIKNNTVSASNGVFRWCSLSRLWSYFRTKLGISSAVGGTANPVYVDSNGQLKAVGGVMLKQGSILDTHSEGSRTILIDGTNELFAFYDRGGTCTAYEYDLEWNSSSPAPAGTFSPADLSSHKTTASVANISANVFNSLTGYNQSTVYSGTKYAVYDLKLPASFSYGTTFYWSFGSSNWKPHYFEVLVWKDDATQYPNGYISKYRSTNVGAYGSVAVGVGATEGNSFTHIRIVMDKYSRLAAFGIVNYSSIGLATNYMSRTVDRSLYRNVTVAKNNTYNLGSSSAKWANVYATNFNGALKGNADTASKATNDADGNPITSTYATKTELKDNVDGKANTNGYYPGMSVGGADNSEESAAVKDYNDLSSIIKIGFAGTSLSSCTYLAAYTQLDGGINAIKDIPTSVVKVGRASNADNADVSTKANFSVNMADVNGYDSGVAIRDAVPFLRFIRGTRTPVGNIFPKALTDAVSFSFTNAYLLILWEVHLENVYSDDVLTFTLYNTAPSTKEALYSSSVFVKAGNSSVMLVMPALLTGSENKKLQLWISDANQGGEVFYVSARGTLIRINPNL